MISKAMKCATRWYEETLMRGIFTLNGVMLAALLERRLDIYVHCIAISGILSKNKSIAQVLGSYGPY